MAGITTASHALIPQRNSIARNSAQDLFYLGSKRATSVTKPGLYHSVSNDFGTACAHEFSPLWCSGSKTSRNITVCTATLPETISDGVQTSGTADKKIRVGRGSKIIGTGSSVPSVVISNDDLSAVIQTSDEWISSRTGIRNRRVLPDGETVTSLATDAARKALAMAEVDPAEVDLVILCTSTPDDIFGSACTVQFSLGCHNAAAFDLTAACSGFVIGLVTATRFIRGGGYRNVLVVGADALSRYVDWSDRGTCILFGDGAGAVVVQAAADDEKDGLMGFCVKSDGKGSEHLQAQISSELRPESSPLPFPSKASPNFIKMNGKEVFKFAVTAVPQVISTALKEAEISSADLDWLLLHQANQRILDSVADKMTIPREKVISNLANYGNTSSASIPIALDEAVRSDKVQPGQVLAIAGFGAGLTWGAVVMRWK